MIEFKDILGLAQPTTKLIEIVSKAIGTLYEPRKIKKLADAEAYRINKLTKTAKETNFNGEIEFLNGKIKINSNDINNNEIKTLIVNEVKKLSYENENIKKIADFAYAELENNKLKVSGNIDEDWAKNFFDKGKKIYREDLQFIFGKILAGEIKQPGTYSKRILGLLYNLSQNEAELFYKISKYALNNGENSFIISDDDILKNIDIKLDDIILLEEAGLFNSNSLNISGVNAYEYKNYLIDFDKEKPIFNIYFLTKAGSELEKLITNDIDLNYLLQIKNKYKIKKIKYGIIMNKCIENNSTNYSLKDIKTIE